MPPERSLDEQADRLRLTVTLAGLVPAALVGVVLLLVVHPLAGVAAFVVIAAAWAVVVQRSVSSAARKVLDPLQATPLPPGAEPRLENLIEGVAVVGGIEEPSLAVVPDDAVNALAVADADGATLVLTSGALGALGRVELEAVLASLAARVKSGAARYVATVVALPLPASYRRTLLRDGLGDQRWVRSDLAAVGLTKYPPGLISALAVMDERGTRVAGATPASAPLWVADPSAGAGPADAAEPAEPLALRIAVLQEL